MMLNEIEAWLKTQLHQPALLEFGNFAARALALDQLEVHVFDRLDGLPALHASAAGQALRQQAEDWQTRLEALDAALMQELRQKLRAGHPLAELLRQYADGLPQAQKVDGDTYDLSDQLINGLLLNRPLPGATVGLETEMVAYQPTPVSVVLDLVKRARLGPQDLFVDLGSGLGQVTLLVHLLSGARTKGIEIEPAFVTYARNLAAELELAQVEFIAADARDADLSGGTVYFLYTPFQGRMLTSVLNRLRAACRFGPRRICSLGPCSRALQQQDWLRREGEVGDELRHLQVFEVIETKH